MILQKNLLEEQFFFLYHYKMEPEKTLRINQLKRKWLIDRFIEQKTAEANEIEKARKGRK